MKRLLVLITATVLTLSGYGQRLKAEWPASRYCDYDSTTFFLGAALGVKGITIEYTTLDDDDAVMFIGMTDGTGQWMGGLKWTSEATSADSLILDATGDALTIRNSSGTRYTTSKTGLWFHNGLPTDLIAFTIYWNSVTTGTIKIYY